MTRSSLADWLCWQESLNPVEIDLGLERVHAVAQRLRLQSPSGRTLVVAGTNGKGSCVAAAEALMRAAGERTGCYTSPHLVRYNERIAIDGVPADDAVIIAAFEAIEAVRGDIRLTYFEFGTLAAFWVFRHCRCSAWVLEVGLGGRLDAVNIIDADVSVVTTVDLDHQAWLGDTVEAIAVEKAGILRAGRPAFYGDPDPPASMQAAAAALPAPLAWPGHGFDATLAPDHRTWSWQGHRQRIDGLAGTPLRVPSQLRNQSLALAAIEAIEPRWLDNSSVVREVLGTLQLPGRMQRHRDSQHEWLLDVAHNPQAAKVLQAFLADTGLIPATVVAGMLADKQAEAFARALKLPQARWIACATGGARGSDAAALSAQWTGVLAQPPLVAASVRAALDTAKRETPHGGVILVCGSFQVVGPALEWLGLY